VSQTDPLTALREADSRSFDQRWREHVIALWGKLPRPPAHLVWIVAGLAAAALVGRSVFTQSDPPIEDSLPVAVAPAAASSAPLVAVPDATAEVAEVVVHVAGAVQRPGLVVGTGGWRVQDAIDTAGGALLDADLDRINLAARISDGQRIYVPVVGEVGVPAIDGGSDQSVDIGPINVNVADAEALESIPGIGPATAATIVAHREEHGPFGSVDSLVAVRGIGPATLDAMRDHVSVG
jgi:competence protein ComEA